MIKLGSEAGSQEQWRKGRSVFNLLVSLGVTVLGLTGDACWGSVWGKQQACVWGEGVSEGEDMWDPLDMRAGGRIECQRHFASELAVMLGIGSRGTEKRKSECIVPGFVPAWPLH